jgi:hypothetical protein
MEGTLLLQVGPRHQCALSPDYPKHFALSWSLGHYGLPLKNPWWAVGGEPRHGGYYVFSYLPPSALWSALGERGPTLSAWLGARAALGCAAFLVLVLVVVQLCGASRLGLWIALMMATWAGGIRIVYLAFPHDPNMVYFPWPTGPRVSSWSELYHWAFQHATGPTICLAALAAAGQPSRAKLIVIPALLATLVGTSVLMALMMFPPFVFCLVALNWGEVGAGLKPASTGQVVSRLRSWALPLLAAAILSGIIALQYRSPGTPQGIPIAFRGWFPLFTRLAPLVDETHLPRALIPAFRLLSPFVWGLMIFGISFVTACDGLIRAWRERRRLPVTLQALTVLAGFSFVFAQVFRLTLRTDELFLRGIVFFSLGVLIGGALGAQRAWERGTQKPPGPATAGPRLIVTWCGYALLLVLLLLAAATTGWELYHYGLRTPRAYALRHVLMPSAQVAAWRFVREHTPPNAHLFCNMDPWGPQLAQYYCQRQLVLGGGTMEAVSLTRDAAGLERDYQWLQQVAREAPTEKLARVLQQIGADYVVLGRNETRTLAGPPGPRPLTVLYWGNTARFRDPRFFAVEYEAGGFLVVAVKKMMNAE